MYLHYVLTKLIILNSPQNPTGAVTTKKELEEIAEIAAEKDIFVITDEIYSKMLYDENLNKYANLDI